MSIHIRNARKYRTEGVGQNWVYVGRKHPRFPHGSPLGNPYPLREDTPRERARVLDAYKTWLRDQFLAEQAVYAELLRLTALYKHTGELNLLCWCAPHACHAEVLAQAIRDLAEEMPPEITGNKSHPQPPSLADPLAREPRD